MAGINGGRSRPHIWGDAAARFGGEIDVLMRFKIKISPLPGQNNNKSRQKGLFALK